MQLQPVSTLAAGGEHPTSMLGRHIGSLLCAWKRVSRFLVGAAPTQAMFAVIAIQMAHGAGYQFHAMTPPGDPPSVEWGWGWPHTHMQAAALQGAMWSPLPFNETGFLRGHKCWLGMSA